ncbi:MAG: hypothetical protein HY319_19410 [Armatimonadetes bacterium]|nr:hypothetical protein [Armatimonadota bacterium]
MAEKVPQNSNPAALTAHRRAAMEQRMAHMGGSAVRQGTEAEKQDRGDRVQLTGQPAVAETARAAEENAAHTGVGRTETRKEDEIREAEAQKHEPAQPQARTDGLVEGANGTLLAQDASTISLSTLQARQESDRAWEGMQQAFQGLSEGEKAEVGKHMTAILASRIPGYDQLPADQKQQKLQELANSEDGWMLQAAGAADWAGQKAEAAAQSKDSNASVDSARRIAQLFYGASNYVQKRQEFLQGVNELNRRGETEMVQNVLNAPAEASGAQQRPGSSAQQPGQPSPVPPGPVPPGSSKEVQSAQMAQQTQQEQDEVKKIFMQMWSDRQKAWAEMWKIMQDTYTSIWETMRSAWLYRAQAGAKANAAWSAYIRGDGVV